MEVAPAVGPVVGHGLGANVDASVADGGLDATEIRQLPLGAIDRVLDPTRTGFLLDAARSELDHLGEHQIGLVRAAAHRQANHGSSSRSSSASAAARCFRLRRSGTTTSNTTCWSPRLLP